MSRAAKPPVDRGGRRAEDPANKRTSALTTKMSDVERESCELAAQREGKTLSEWARNTLLLRASASG